MKKSGEKEKKELENPHKVVEVKGAEIGAIEKTEN
jgi:hypothetical protein